jgi:hypothetical protein
MPTILAVKPQGRENCKDVIVGVNVKLKFYIHVTVHRDKFPCNKTN